jgi:hypothetical protein
MDGSQRAEQALDRPWPDNPAPIAFGRRQAGNGEPSQFRGVVDEIRLDATAKQSFSRMSVFQIGSETYHYARELRLAIGDGSGLKKVWAAAWGGGVDRTEPLECTGRPEDTQPDVRIAVQDDIAEFTLRGGVGIVPVTLTGLSRPSGFRLQVDGETFDRQDREGRGHEVHHHHQQAPRRLRDV